MAHQVAYKLKYKLKAIEDLSRLPQATRKRIEDQLEWLVENFDQISSEALEGDFASLFQLWMGKYSANYDVDRQDRVIIVESVANRVYRHDL